MISELDIGIANCIFGLALNAFWKRVLHIHIMYIITIDFKERYIYIYIYMYEAGKTN